MKIMGYIMEVTLALAAYYGQLGFGMTFLWALSATFVPSWFITDFFSFGFFLGGNVLLFDTVSMGAIIKFVKVMKRMASIL